MNPRNKQDAPVALITGGARRIGASIVRTLHKAGYKVVIHCHKSLDEAHELALTLNEQRANSAFVISRDLSLPYAAQEIISSIEDWAGRLDLLINNASVFIRTDYKDLEMLHWDTLFNTNVKAPFLLSLAAQSLLATYKGVIINITDTHAKRPLSGYSTYCQSKAALEMQTKTLALEFAPEIRVNAIAPGAIIWPEHENSLDTATQKKIISKTPLKQHGSPEFIAQAVLALAENPFITGQILRVDGGRGL